MEPIITIVVFFVMLAIMLVIARLILLFESGLRNWMAEDFWSLRLIGIIPWCFFAVPALFIWIGICVMIAFQIRGAVRWFTN